ncbi:MAG: TIR domain-containing protein, partial [Candidatus Lokiarchaeota archaeon]|nr:TIR domain-containing protein [Candidatus Lokiarchaeota archaeon]
EPVKILVDTFDVISKIIENEKLVKKILRKFAALENPKLPETKKDLKEYLSKDLKENVAEMKITPPFSAYNGDEPYIFVSYTHKDKANVYPIINYVHNKGYKIWYDEGIPISTDWANTIGEKLLGCELFLTFISEAVCDSDNTQDEIHLAVNEKKTLVAVYLEDCNIPAGLKMRMRRIQGILKYEMSEEKFYKKLMSELNRLMESG